MKDEIPEAPNGSALPDGEFDVFVIAQRPEWKEVLVDIVKQERMDPWDIDIGRIAKRFLELINERKALNLRISANVLLAASILLRYKCDAWNIKGEKEGDPIIFIPDDIIAEPVIPELQAIARTTTRKVSLQELIDAVDSAIGKEKTRAARRPMEHVVPEPLLAMIDTNPELFEQKIKAVFELVKKNADKEKLTAFSQILDENTASHVIDCLLPLLHLANSQKVAIWQEQIFGEIFIHLLEENGFEDKKPKEPKKIEAT